MLKNILLFIISIYKKVFSLDSGILRFLLIPIIGIGVGNKICRHSPSCSTYCYEAISKYGIIEGARLGLFRILSCHPYSS